MPFFDDSGPRLETAGGPVTRAFGLLRDQLERWVALNLLWAAPASLVLAAGITPGLPEGARVGLTVGAAAAWLPATAALFPAAQTVGAGAPLSGALLRAALQHQWRAAFTKLLPLYSTFIWLALAAGAAEARGWLWLDVLARLLFLGLLLPALYWGPLTAAEPTLSVAGLARRSLRLVWRQPGTTLLVGLISAAAALLGLLSVAGALLIVPVLLVVLQNELYRAGQPAAWAGEPDGNA